MKYGQIRKYDVANGPGIRTSIFVTGCSHNCYACFNKEYQDADFGEDWTFKQTEQILDYLSLDEVDGLTLLGGEPFENLDGLIDLLQEVRKKSDKSIWVYSGYTFEQILKDEKKLELLKLCDILVDGLFVNNLKDLRLKFRGSSNQRIIKIKESLKENMPVIWEE
ncbi:anaerobic ribonucleoside-triphosphate reductase activating protein [Peptoniphilus sp. GNH]|nr:anaerobic ribonucleoside-triphosphate reductase activating protein [Clostridiales bacterium KA00134]UHR03466.1 anaerobic ribonucleoside-triphosphate reductase activating protein [Peptoniphilus sp. GNH]